MTIIRRLAALLTLGLAAVAGIVVVGAGAAEARILTDLPTPKPLRATLTAECTGLHFEDERVRWHAWNDTNGPHLFEFRHNGNLVYQFLMQPGEHRTSSATSPLWTNTVQHFEIRAMGKTRALLHERLDCRPADISAFVIGSEDEPPCPGSVKVEAVNSGGKAADVQVTLDGTQVGAKTLLGHEMASTLVQAGAGQVIAVHHEGETVFSVEVAACGQGQAEPPADEPPADGPQVEPVDEDPPVAEPPPPGPAADVPVSTVGPDGHARGERPAVAAEPSDSTSDRRPATRTSEDDRTDDAPVEVELARHAEDGPTGSAGVPVALALLAATGGAALLAGRAKLWARSR